MIQLPFNSDHSTSLQCFGTEVCSSTIETVLELTVAFADSASTVLSSHAASYL